MKKNITAHMIICNEDRFVWYAVNSILGYVDVVLIFDTGSTDQTLAVIRKIGNRKIILIERSKTDSKGMTALRNEQIAMTKTDWLWLVDGDEVYSQKTVQRVHQEVKANADKLGIIIHRYDLLGDIYHAQEERVGAYDQFGRKGHYALRLVNKSKIPGLQVRGDYPQEYYADVKGHSIKKAGRDSFIFIEERFFHAMYLSRSTDKDTACVLNRKKPKIESGIQIPEDDLPEVFFGKLPVGISQVNGKRSKTYEIQAAAVTPVKKLKRKLFPA